MVLKIPVTEKHHIEIGKVSTHFALLESYISNLIIIFLEKDQRIGQIITSNCSFQRLMDLLSSLAKYKLKDLNDLSDLEDLMKRANQVEQKRNSIVHSIYAAGTTSDMITRLKMIAKQDRGFKFSSQDLTAEDIHLIAEEISKVAEDIQQFSIRISKDNL